MTEVTTSTTEVTTSTTEESMEFQVAQFVEMSNFKEIATEIISLKRQLMMREVTVNQMRENQDKARQTLRETRDEIRAKFITMLDGDKNAVVEMNLEDINELLEDIGASKISFTWTCEVTVTATLTGIEADSEEEARNKALQSLELKVDTNELGEDGNCEDEEYEVDNVEEEAE